MTLVKSIKNIERMWKAGKLAKMPKHKIAELMLYHKGKPLSLEEYEPFHHLYNVDAPEMIFKTGRQVSKSTTCSNLEILKSFFRENYSILYVAPLEIQVYRYSTLYLKANMMDSPLIKTRMSSDGNKTVMSKSFTNGAKIQCVYTSTNNGATDRARGISCDEVNYDEIQDIPEDSIKIIEQCMSGSRDYGYSKYFGTPKTMDNVIEKIWQRSSQNIYVSKCTHCGHWNVPVLPDVFRMIHKDGPVCIKCQKPINPSKGCWVSFNRKMQGVCEGFHVPQPIVSFNLEPERWKRLYRQFMLYPRATFANEVLGLSYDVGGKLITLTELRNLMVIDKPYNKADYLLVVAGIDWGGGGFHSDSYTKIVVMGIKYTGVSEVIYWKMYNDSQPLEQVKDITNILRAWNVDYAAPDQGMGHTNNDLLRESWGKPDCVIPFMYSSMGQYIRYDKKRFLYMIDKTATLNMMYIWMKRRQVLFPKDETLEAKNGVFDDLLSIVEEESESAHSSTKKIFQRTAGHSDDYAHCINFAGMLLKKLTGIPIVDFEENDNYISVMAE